MKHKLTATLVAKLLEEGPGPVDVDTHLVFCGGCLWWASDEGADKGKCHRHAPRPGNFGWATTKRDDFCGESDPKPDTTPIAMH